MPNEPGSGYVSDPVHTMIRFTRIERWVIDHFLTQRLRRVAQSGLNSYAYPEVVSTRFAHCIGSMHLASDFMTSCIQNSDDEDLDLFAVGMNKTISAITGSSSYFEDDRVIQVTGTSLDSPQLRAHLVFKKGNGTEKQKESLIIAEQALRLATLFHDLGHLPFSHTFEDAISDMAGDPTLPDELRDLVMQIEGNRKKDDENDGEKLHEMIGLALGHLLLRDLLSLKKWPSDEDNLFKLLFHIVLAIWNSELPWKLIPPSDAKTTTKKESIATEDNVSIAWLKSLVSGQFDIDRADYVLRDGRNYGFDFASFGLRRLINQSRICRLENQSLVLAIRPQGIGFMESFVLARYRSYQYGVLHHKVAQVSMALQHVISEGFQRSFSEANGSATATRDSIQGLSEVEQGAVLYPAKQLMRFLKDVARLQAYQKNLSGEGKKSGAPLAGKPSGHVSSRLLDGNSEDEYAIVRRFAEYDDYWFTTCLRAMTLADGSSWEDLVWWRQPTIRSLWKRPNEFEAALEEAFPSDATNEVPNTIEVWNSALEAFSELKLEEKARWNQLRRELVERGVLISDRRFPPFKKEMVNGRTLSQGLFVYDDKEKEMRTLAEVSPLIKGLGIAWDQDLRLYASMIKVESDEATFKQTQIDVLHKTWSVIRVAVDWEG